MKRSCYNKMTACKLMEKSIKIFRQQAKLIMEMYAKMEEKNLPVIIEPIIDGHTPPVSVDTVSVGQGRTGGLRLIGYAGNIYPQREEQLTVNGEKVRRLWVRPVCVLDISEEARKFLEEYLLYSISENPQKLQSKEKYFPDVFTKLKTAIKGVKDDE